MKLENGCWARESGARAYLVTVIRNHPETMSSRGKLEIRPNLHGEIRIAVQIHINSRDGQIIRDVTGARSRNFVEVDDVRDEIRINHFLDRRIRGELVLRAL